MRNYQIHLIRHGRTAGNRQGRFIGATDLPLSGAGREQLRTLAEQCHYPSAELVYTAAHTRAEYGRHGHRYQHQRRPQLCA